MSLVVRWIIIALILTTAWAAPAAAQSAAGRGKLIVTVSDPSGAVIPDATVTLVGLDETTKATPIPPAKTTDKGAVTFDGLALGRYSSAPSSPGSRWACCATSASTAATTSTSSCCR